MAKGKKEPINVTPPPAPQFLVKSERVKVIVMFNGDNVICDLQEAVDKDSAEKTLAFKYFNGNKEDLVNYLFPKDNIVSAKKTSCFANCQQLELL